MSPLLYTAQPPVCCSGYRDWWAADQKMTVGKELLFLGENVHWHFWRGNVWPGGGEIILQNYQSWKSHLKRNYGYLESSLEISAFHYYGWADKTNDFSMVICLYPHSSRPARGSRPTLAATAGNTADWQVIVCFFLLSWKSLQLCIYSLQKLRFYELPTSFIFFKYAILCKLILLII